MELTEFEKRLKFLCSAFQHVDSSSDDVINGVIQDYANELLDLAIKEEILKDLPKWKRVPKTWKVEDNAKVVFSEDYKYYIDKKELFKKLQKE